MHVRGSCTGISHSPEEKSYRRHQNAFFPNHNPSLPPIPSPTLQSAPDEEVLSAVPTDVCLSCFFTGCRIDNCEACFSKDFCTKCKPGFYLHKGRCFEKCPEGFAPLDDSMECGEGCEVGQWSDWGTCTRRNKTCGFKWGLETRTRHIVKKPPKDTIPCPTIAESRRCKMAMRHCRRGEYLRVICRANAFSQQAREPLSGSVMGLLRVLYRKLWRDQWLQRRYLPSHLRMRMDGYPATSSTEKELHPYPPKSSACQSGPVWEPDGDYEKTLAEYRFNVCVALRSTGVFMAITGESRSAACAAFPGQVELTNWLVCWVIIRALRPVSRASEGEREEGREVRWISFQTYCPWCKSRESGCSYASLHSIINGEVGGVDEIKEQQRKQLLIVDPLKDEKVLNRRRAFAERPIYRSLVMLS
ncbi:R-spondin-2 [Labeo rohita]|uniref:R-spondin-2 n=1 Tax=Labeo rohita TaxID=84645 RepID=A0ABQ8LWP9_LABRO|nr:R-spondin-2 [Labeo rohita]